MTVWIRIRDGFVNSDHIVEIVENVRDGADISILHLVGGATAVADIDSHTLIEQIRQPQTDVCLSPEAADDDEDLPF